MFGFFKNKTQKEKLIKEYEKLKKKAFELSKTNRNASDQMTAKAEELWEKIEALGDQDK